MRNILQSKTVLLNVVITALEILAVTEGLIPSKYLIYSTTGKAVLNVILRVWFNSGPLLPQSSPATVSPIHDDEIE